MIHEERLKALRNELVQRDLGGFIVPVADEFLSEYVGAYARRLAWLTGFEGSAGTAVVLLQEAAIFVDGRYTLQVRERIDKRYWSCQSVPETDVVAWLAERAPAGVRVGYDPWLHTKRWVVAAHTALLKRNAQLVAVVTNPVDAVWQDRPRPKNAKLAVYPEVMAGKSATEKLRDIADRLALNDADAVVLSALDSIAWTFNVRGQDVDHTPVAMAYAVVQADRTADLLVAREKLTPEVIAHLDTSVRLHSPDTFVDHLAGMGSKRVLVDPERAVTAIFDVLNAAHATVIEARDPVLLPKAIKNSAEIAGHRDAQARDGAALSRFLHWFSVEAPKGTLTEMSAAARLREFREATGKLRDLSFGTISGFGPNGAIIHYQATEQTSRQIVPGALYLVDSGGQYLDGTTDVTRTVAVGIPTVEMRDRFTGVLKGHIALASAVFPVGTRGGQLDILARQYLWAAGLDYAHGTGHGVGAYLSVHEGPQRISNVGDCSEPLVPGMILSNEPGYYKAGEYGIRIENLMLVVERTISGAEREMLGFETLTFAPIDRRMIDAAMLSTEERSWIDSYHSDVRKVVGPQLDGPAKEWLIEVTQTLS